MLKVTARNKMKMFWDKKNQYQNILERTIRDVALEIFKGNMFWI